MECSIDPNVQKVLERFMVKNKPMLFTGVAPVLAAKLFFSEVEDVGAVMTLSNDACGSQSQLEKIRRITR